MAILHFHFFEFCFNQPLLCAAGAVFELFDFGEDALHDTIEVNDIARLVIDLGGSGKLRIAYFVIDADPEKMLST